MSITKKLICQGVCDCVLLRNWFVKAWVYISKMTLYWEGIFKVLLCLKSEKKIKL